MACAKGSRAVLCFTPQYVLRDRNGKVWPFEFHKFCGPTILTKKGEPWKRYPGEKSPFWAALESWLIGGAKVKEKDGVSWAIWP